MNEGALTPSPLSVREMRHNLQISAYRAFRQDLISGDIMHNEYINNVTLLHLYKCHTPPI